MENKVKYFTLQGFFLLLFHIHREWVCKSIWNLFNGDEMDHISKIFSKRYFVDCNFLLVYWKSIHLVQYFILAVALYRPNFFRRSLWVWKLVKLFLLLCKCNFNFFLQLIFKFHDLFGQLQVQILRCVFFFIVFRQHFSRKLDLRRSWTGSLTIVFRFEVTEISLIKWQ